MGLSAIKYIRADARIERRVPAIDKPTGHIPLFILNIEKMIGKIQFLKLYFNLKMNRTTIAVFSDWADSPYHKSILSGINEKAKEYDINVITYVGGAFKAPFRWEHERNIIYNFINRELINGLIILSGSIGRYCDSAEMLKFYNSYAPIPIISLSQSFENINSLIIDNRAGIRELIFHCVEKHNYKKIAFVCGPEVNQEAIERFDAYKETLEECGIAFNPALVLPGNFTLQSGIDAITILLDQEKQFPEIIICSNDDMAQGAVFALQKRGILVPGEIAVAGFDDQEKSRFLTPPLTTIGQPLFEQGKQAVHSLRQLIKGEKLPLRIYLPSKLVIRQSCGCSWEEVEYGTYNKFLQDPASLKVTHFENSWESIQERVIQKLNEYSSTIEQKLNPAELKEFLNSFYASVMNRKKDSFLAIMHKAFHNIENKINLELFLSKALSCIAIIIEEEINDIKEILFIKEICYHGQIIINSHIIQSYKDLLLKIEQIHQIIHYTSGEALTITSLDAILKLLSEKLPQLGITDFLFTFYEKLNQNEPEKSISRLAIAFIGNKQVNLPKNGIVFSSVKLFPRNIVPESKRFSYIVEPLFFGPLHFGVAILEAEIQLNSILNTMFRWFLNSIIIVELFVIHMQKQKSDIEEQMNFRTGELTTVNRKLSDTLNQLKATQTTLLQQAKLASLGRLTSGIAHELKNPLNFINNFSKINMDDTDELKDILNRYQGKFKPGDLEQITRLLSDIKDNSREVYTHGIYADKIIKDMLNQARGENRMIETCRINSLIKEIISLSERSQRSVDPNFNITIIEELDPKVPEIKANVTDLNKVFINMTDNAFYAMKKRWHTQPEYNPVFEVSTQYQHNLITIRFKDNGTGIKEDAMDHIYDPFFTTKPAGEGTGIGLKTCYEIVVEGMGGELSCESEENQGTIFTVKLKI